jgi:hypothetical protein
MSTYLKERSKFFTDKSALVRERFESYKRYTTQPEHAAICELFLLYDNAMNWFFAVDKMTGEEIQKWQDKLSMAGIRAYRIYTNLRDKGIDVEYCKEFLKGSKKVCNLDPEKLEFHLQEGAIDCLLNFCIRGEHVGA